LSTFILKNSQNIFSTSDNKNMIVEGYTTSELAELTQRNRHAVEAWLSYNKIKPVINEVLYPPETLELLKNAKVGRPRKPKPL
jgi:hypothetical protein